MWVETIRSMHTHNRWANERVLACASQLPADQFVAEDDTPWGSIRNQLVHTFGVHKRWLSWADGSMDGEEAYGLPIEFEEYPDFGAVEGLWNETWAQTDAFLARITDDDLARVLTIDRPNIKVALPVWNVMVHLASHSMQHRTETSMALTKLGHSPGDLDYIFYVFEMNANASS